MKFHGTSPWYLLDFEAKTRGTGNTSAKRLLLEDINVTVVREQYETNLPLSSRRSDDIRLRCLNVANQIVQVANADNYCPCSRASLCFRLIHTDASARRHHEVSYRQS